MSGAQQTTRPAGGGGFRIVSFPKEFERNVWETLDKRFYIILLTSLAIVYGLLIVLANLKFSQEEMANKIREKYLKQLYTAQIAETTPVGETETKSTGLGEEAQPEKKIDQRAQKDQGKRTEVRGQSAAQRRASARAAAAARGRQRAAIENKVAGMGVLGVLSAGGSGGSGEAVDDIVGGNDSGFGNLDKVLSQAGGLQTGTASSRTSVLGSRKMGGGIGGTAGIDDLIEGGVGATSSKSIARRGKFSIKMSKGNVSGRAAKSTARSVDAIGRVVTQHEDAIMSCYKKEARLNPKLKGSISVIFTIRANGRVTGVRVVKSTIRNRSVESCVTRRIRSWRFAPINPKEGDVHFLQTFVLSS